MKTSAVVEIVIDETGDVVDATIRQSLNAGFDNIIVGAARRWKYRPAMKDGVAGALRQDPRPGSVDEDTMYERFYGLSRGSVRADRRIRDSCSSRRSTAKRSAISSTGCRSRKPITVLIGEAGTGKSTLLRAALASELLPPRHVRLHRQPDADARRVLRDAGLAIRPRRERAEHRRRRCSAAWSAIVRDRQSRGEITALVVDEAQALPDEILEEIRLLANMETADEQAAAGGARRPARARGAVERAWAAAAEAAHRAALRAQAARSAGHRGLHRLAHPDGGRRSRRTSSRARP